MTKEWQQEFITNELWTLTIGAAFQRSNIYDTVQKDFDKKKYRDALKEFITIKIQAQYQKQVTENTHVKNIQRLQDFSKEKGVPMNFGISQKLLNLFLKYEWCRGKISTPPHFPVDRIIQQKLGITQPIAWTKMEDKNAYLAIIKKAKNILQEEAHQDCPNIAALELKLFGRR